MMNILINKDTGTITFNGAVTSITLSSNAVDDLSLYHQGLDIKPEIARALAQELRFDFDLTEAEEAQAVEALMLQL